MVQRCLLVCIVANLGSEGVRRLVKRLLDCILADTFKELIILTWVAIATIGRTVKPGRKALTVELEAARIAAITSFTGHRC